MSPTSGSCKVYGSEMSRRDFARWTARTHIDLVEQRQLRQLPCRCRMSRKLFHLLGDLTQRKRFESACCPAFSKRLKDSTCKMVHLHRLVCSCGDGRWMVEVSRVALPKFEGKNLLGKIFVSAVARMRREQRFEAYG